MGARRTPRFNRGEGFADKVTLRRVGGYLSYVQYCTPTYAYYSGVRYIKVGRL